MTPFQIVCSKCSSKINVSNEKFVGKKVPCPKCKAPLFIEQPIEVLEELEVIEEVAVNDDANPLGYVDPFQMPIESSMTPSNAASDPFASALSNGQPPGEFWQSQAQPRPATVPVQPARQKSALPLIIALSAAGCVLFLFTLVGLWFVFSRSTDGSSSNNESIETASWSPIEQVGDIKVDPKVGKFLAQPNKRGNKPIYFGFTENRKKKLLAVATQFVQEMGAKENRPKVEIDEALKRLVEEINNIEAKFERMAVGLNVVADKNGNFNLPMEGDVGAMVLEIAKGLQEVPYKNKLFEEFGISETSLCLSLIQKHNESKSSPDLDYCILLLQLLSIQNLK